VIEPKISVSRAQAATNTKHPEIVAGKLTTTGFLGSCSDLDTGVRVPCGVDESGEFFGVSQGDPYQ
jgi:hypothetical protein